jgi:glycosyltransferase involved in cell wall biosynthesis
MKILHFTLGKVSTERANGVNQVVAGLAKYSARAGARVRVIGKTRSVASGGEMLARDGFEAELFPAWRRPLRAHLEEAIQWADIVHLHGGYSPWNILVGRMCDVLHTPYVVTLHNALSPDLAAMRGRLRKAVFHWLAQRRHLQRAAALHVLTEEESTEALRRVQSPTIFCIPNGIDPDDYPTREPRRGAGSSSSDLTIGYLGRLSPEKNLEALCAAVGALAATRDLRLKLAGPMTEYGWRLRSQAPEGRVELIGPVYGAAKTAFMESVDLLVIPSLSEGFSVAAVEALATRTPLLITRTSKMGHFFDRNAFFMCEPTDFGIQCGLQRALAARNTWDAVTRNGRRLVEECLNWRVIAQQMLERYETIVRQAK